MLKNIFLLCCGFVFVYASNETTRMLDLLDKRQEQGYINQELDYTDRKDPLSKNQQEQYLTKQKTYFFKTIEFDNEDVPKPAEEILHAYTNRYITINEIYEIIQKTTNYFISKGYSTTIVTIKKLDELNQKLILEIKYGYVDHIYLNNIDDSRKIFFGIPLDKGDKFNIFDLDQGLENLNNPSYLYNINIQPSDKMGYSDIYIYDKHYSYGTSLSVDNSASKDKGAFRATLSYTKSNLFGINDNLSLIYMDRLVQHRSKNKEYMYAFSYVVPIRYWELAYSLQYSNARSFIQGSYGNFLSKNNTIRHKILAKKVIYRSQISKTSLYAGANLKDNKNKISDVVIDSSSGRYTSVLAGLEHSTRIFNGSFFMALEYQNGIPFLGAKGDSLDSLYKVNFQKIYINMAYQKHLYKNNNFGLFYRSNISGSYSPDPLLYADKFLVGDEYTVRGFKESSAAWDYGVFMNNTLSFRLNQFQSLNLEPFLGIDFAYGKDYLLPKSDFLMGASVGLRLALKNFHFDFTFAKDLHRGYKMPKESMPMYLRAKLII